MNRFYVYAMCDKHNNYRWVCRFNDLHTALESCNRKRFRGVDSFVSTRNNIGLHAEPVEVTND